MPLIKYEAGDFWVSQYGPIEIMANLPNNKRLIRFLFTDNYYIVNKSQVRDRTVVDLFSSEKPSFDNLHITVEHVLKCKSKQTGEKPCQE